MTSIATDGLIFTPSGTVTIAMFEDAGRMEIHASAEPDPADWEVAAELIGTLGDGTIAEILGADSEVDVYVVNIPMVALAA